MKIIYEPKSQAKEYAQFALNIYNGCQFGCRYCIFRLYNGAKYHISANPKKKILAKLNADIDLIIETFDYSPEILLCAQGDPYQPVEMELLLTRMVLRELTSHHFSYSILTKGGTRAGRDFDLLKEANARYGTSLSFIKQSSADYWEPNAAPIKNRIKAIMNAKKAGISTWLNLEPVIEPDQAIQIVKNFHPFVDQWTIGKIVHPDLEPYIDWYDFREEIQEELERVGATYYFMDSLAKLNQ